VPVRGAFKRGQFDKEVIGDFHGKYFVTFLGDASMANRLAMDKTQGIMQLFAAGMRERQIARTLDIDRKSVDRELRLQGAKGAKSPTGCETSNSATVDASTINKAEASTSDRNASRSQYQAFHDLITQKLEMGLDAQRVYQDLVRDHGFSGSYYSVRRYVRRLGNRLVDRVRRIELPPAEVSSL
jgi:IS30 family transposase